MGVFLTVKCVLNFLKQTNMNYTENHYELKIRNKLQLIK